MYKKGLIFCLFAMLFCSCIDEQTAADSIVVGDKLPPFSVRMSDGTVVSDTSLRGTNALIVFFNTSCPDCQRELPVVNEFFLRATNCQTVCISRAENESSVNAYWLEHGFSMPYSAQTDRQVYELFAVSRIPRLYAVNKEGIVVALWDDSAMPSVDELLTQCSATP